MKRKTTIALAVGILATALMVMMASVAWADFASIVLSQKIKLKDGQTLVIAGQIEGFGAQVTWRLDERRCEVVAFDGTTFTVLEDDSFFGGNPAHAAIFTGVILLRQTGERDCKVRSDRGEYVAVNTDPALLPPGVAIRIGAAPIALTAEHQTSPVNIRAFIPTDSMSTTCLVSLSESNFAVNGTTVFCGARTFGTENGISVNILLPSEPPVSPDPFWTVVVYQEGAKRYGTPVPFPGP